MAEKDIFPVIGMPLKRFAYQALTFLKADALSRFINRKRILILAYHGVTSRSFLVRPWILFPLESFEEQIRFLQKHYSFITLRQAIAAIREGSQLPDNPAVVTFDDGYRNNLTTALPVLKKYGVPATVFLTAGYIGSDRILPLDRAYLIIAYSRRKKPLMMEEIGLGPLCFSSNESIAASYIAAVTALKRLPTKVQEKYLDIMEKRLEPEYCQNEAFEEFQLLSWEEVNRLVESGIIDIGAHTISHEILTNVSNEEVNREVMDSKAMIEHHIPQPVDSFAYPNGTARDFNESHIKLLRESGFTCSVTTIAGLNQYGSNPYTLGRISVGPDFVNNLHHFALKISGFNLFMKKALRGYHG